MIAKKDLPANDLKGLVAWMKANPGKITFVNQNAAAQVTGILFEQATGQKVQFIPYRGAGPAMTDLISGQVDLLVVQAAVTLPQVQAGTVKVLANLSPQRSAAIPDIPTSDESGVPGLYMSGWFGFFGPRGTAEGRAGAAQRRDGARRSPIRRCASASPTWASTSPRASSRRRRGSPRSRRLRSRNGGRSSRPPTSRASEGDMPPDVLAKVRALPQVQSARALHF